MRFRGGEVPRNDVGSLVNKFSDTKGQILFFCLYEVFSNENNWEMLIKITFLRV